MIMRILCVLACNTSSYADVRKLSGPGSLEGLMVPRVLFEVAYRLIVAGVSVELLDCNLVAFSNPENPERAVEEAVARRLGGTHTAVFLIWPTVTREYRPACRQVDTKDLFGTDCGWWWAMNLVRGNALEQITADIFYAGDGVEIPQLLSALDSGKRDVPGMCTREGVVGSTQREMLDGYSAEALYTVNGTFDFASYVQKYRYLGLQPMGLPRDDAGVRMAVPTVPSAVSLSVRYREPRTVADEAGVSARHGVTNNYLIDSTLGLHKKKTAVLLELLAGVKSVIRSLGGGGITRCDHVTRGNCAASYGGRLPHAVNRRGDNGPGGARWVQKRAVSSASKNAVQVLGEAGINARLLLMHFPNSRRRNRSVLIRAAKNLRLSFSPPCFDRCITQWSMPGEAR